MFRRLLLINIIFYLALGFPLFAQEVDNSFKFKDGIIRLDEQFIIFPAGKMGNSLYRDREHLVSDPDLELFDIKKSLDGYVYVGRTTADTYKLGYIGNSEESDGRLRTYSGGYYQLRVDSYRKLYRINNQQKIQDLLPRSRTANGLVVSPAGTGAFYHISKGESVEDEDGKVRHRVTFKIHIIKPETLERIDLAGGVEDYSYRLKLQWVDENTLQYKLSDGQIHQIDIR